MTDEPERNFLVEAHRLLDAETSVGIRMNYLPEVQHLLALREAYEHKIEQYECRLIKLCNMLEHAKREALNG